MGKYGKANQVKIDPFSYNSILMGEGKIGKTTIVYEMCKKYLPEEGYMFLELGKEEGHTAIQGIIAEECRDWDKFDDVITDIIENKTTDYPNLRVVVIDTLDQLFEIAEPETIRLWNIILANRGEQKRVSSINEAFAGFGKGLDKTVEIIFDKLWALKEVGVSFFIIGHVKMKDVTDAPTQQTYQKLTSDMTQRYFNAIKNKAHFVGLAYIDRNIQTVSTGKKDSKGNEIKKGIAKGDKRKIRFRDDNYALDSGSRFADIVSEIPMDADAYYTAMCDAIKKEQAKSGKTFEETKKEQEEAETIRLELIKKAEEQERNNKMIKQYQTQIVDILQNNKSNSDCLVAFTNAKPKNINKFEDINDIKILKNILKVLEQYQ